MQPSPPPADPPPPQTSLPQTLKMVHIDSVLAALAKSNVTVSIEDLLKIIHEEETGISNSWKVPQSITKPVKEL